MPDQDTNSSDTLKQNIKDQDGPENALSQEIQKPARGNQASRNGMNHPTFDELNANKAAANYGQAKQITHTPGRAVAQDHPDFDEIGDKDPKDKPVAGATANLATTPQGRETIAPTHKLGEGIARGLAEGPKVTDPAGVTKTLLEGEAIRTAAEVEEAEVLRKAQEAEVAKAEADKKAEEAKAAEAEGKK